MSPSALTKPKTTTKRAGDSRLPAASTAMGAAVWHRRAATAAIKRALPTRDHAPVERGGLAGDLRPGELLDRAPAPGAAHRGGAVGVGQQGVDALGELGGEAVGVLGTQAAAAGGLEGDEDAGLVVDDDLEDAARRRRDDRRLAGHRLEVDDAQRLVDRRAREDGRVREQLDELGARDHLADPHDAVAPRAQRVDARLDGRL